MRWIWMGITAALAMKAVAWGDHGVITRAAVDVLPQQQRLLLGSEAEALVQSYCFIPDRVGVDLENRPLVEGFLSNQPLNYSGRFENFHLPFGAIENREILLYQIQNVLGALSTNNIPLAARYMGILAHMLEDWTCPAHVTVGDNMFMLMTQYFPPPEAMKYKLFHGPIESGGFEISIPGYEPESLGTTSEEIAFNLLWKSQQGTVFARGRTGAILLAIYAGDAEKSRVLQRECAVVGAKLVADAFHTLLNVAAKLPMRQSYAVLSLENLFPVEQPHLYWPQRTFVGKPYWGHPMMNAVLKDGREPVGLVLTEDGKRRRVSGFSCGPGAQLSYSLPKDVYRELTATVGLHSDLGGDGHVAFRIWGNGKQISEVVVRGSETAVPLRIPLSGITNLAMQVVLMPGANPVANYAVWGNPLLLRAETAP